MFPISAVLGKRFGSIFFDNLYRSCSNRPPCSAVSGKESLLFTVTSLEMSFKFSLLSLILAVTAGAVLIALETQLSISRIVFSRVSKIGFGDIALLALLAAIIALPTFLRKLRFQLMAGHDFVCPICSSEVDETLNQCKKCGHHFRR